MTNVLDLEMSGNDAGAANIRDYLKALLLELWREGEGFSGKRPFGNSGWRYDLYIPLVKAGLVTGTFDSDGCLEECDDAAADKIITEAIKAL